MATVAVARVESGRAESDAGRWVRHACGSAMRENEWHRRPATVWNLGGHVLTLRCCAGCGSHITDQSLERY